MNINLIENPEDKTLYKYVHRSCRNCENLEDCIVFKSRDPSVPTLDRAKCNCLRYKGLYENEKPISFDKKKKRKVK